MQDALGGFQDGFQRVAIDRPVSDQASRGYGGAYVRRADCPETTSSTASRPDTVSSSESSQEVKAMGCPCALVFGCH